MGETVPFLALERVDGVRVLVNTAAISYVAERATRDTTSIYLLDDSCISVKHNFDDLKKRLT